MDELDRFLRGTKVSESLSRELRDELHIQTNVEELVIRELAAGRDVVLAGSAGSGKTHLLHRLRAYSADPVRRADDATPSNTWDFIEDATTRMDGGDAETSLRELFNETGTSASRIIAINHGVLLDLARGKARTWALVRDALHAGQKGRPVEANPDVPLVVDVEGLSPARSGVVGALLQHELLQKFVDLRKCGCGEECPRVLAWTQLGNDEVLGRVNELIEFSEANVGTIQWRDIWQFIQDLLLSGTCDSDIPTSTWFYQVFFGTNRISRMIRGTVDVTNVVLPVLDSAVWYGDWLRVNTTMVPNVELVLHSPSTCEQSDSFQWMKSQLFFTSSDAAGVLAESIGAVHPKLQESIRNRQPRELIRSLNAFMSYEHNKDSAAELILWTDFGVERRFERPTGQVALGRAPTESFRIVSSRVAANPSQEISEAANSGSSRFLLHESDVSLPLETWLLRILNERRSPLQSRRDHSELEWHVRKFYAAIADSLTPQHTTEVMRVSFDTLETTSRAYSISGSLLERIDRNG